MSELRTVESDDGTTIAYERAGSGPVVVFLAGAFNTRGTCAELAGLLTDDFTTVLVDRRGRGDSTDALAPADVGSYRVDLEVADLDAVLAAEGGRAAVFGFSSGGTLALHAAAAGSAISGLVLYEAPFALAGLPAAPADAPQRLAALVAEGRRGDAVELMQREVIGLPPAMVEQARQSPMWAALEAIAPTVVYDATITHAPNVPTPAMRALDVPTLVVCGQDTWPALRASGVALADELARASYAEVAGGAGHGIAAEATAALLRERLRPEPSSGVSRP
ncbi:alpha/beta hydrolase [Cellulomonas sp. DKR-3]|uniref:Alpha/beta hydrolase n=1 Tax=Cellulomonas fulva TaxID=2835530 RepID=A0ABS5TZF1_9CELL|nr:alpha/beta hydrolase [Cellulomonas fulva]MBT0994491.1 alpha/beta hydrolase [Cellulomonas fulva]